ncbi:MAG: bifunctional phosphoribosylaminoimidazolecarboxamide formyltransferase/IMP cyclohydrolase [Polyangiales bacterium]
MFARALLSVSDKEGLLPLAQALVADGCEILSTGGTARMLVEAGVPVTEVAAYTESPEVMDGRVKTLHPRVHGALLMRAGQDEAALTQLGGRPIDLLVVNLYPFAATVARGAAPAVVIENIDIGGPAMLRSAAKNHARVTVVVDPADYAAVQACITGGQAAPAELRSQLAQKVFAHTAAYDAAVAAYLSRDMERPDLPAALSFNLERAYPLRYGENPHQQAAFYRERDAGAGTLAAAQSLNPAAKELSFNNLVDLDAAFEAAREFGTPAAVVVKHTNPCGVAQAGSLVEAYQRARDADSLSAFGSIVALNRPVDSATAKLLSETFIECVLAPAFEPQALAHLRQKRNLRLIATGPWPDRAAAALQCKRISGAFVVQTRDVHSEAEVLDAAVVTERVPTEAERADLAFAWSVCKHVKSNAIVLAKALCTVGIGAGQMSRVVSVDIAARKAEAKAHGSVLASDAFFPFADGIEAAARAGVKAVVQPGGSKRDDEVIAAANAAGIAMLCTGRRHFRH